MVSPLSTIAAMLYLVTVAVCLLAATQVKSGERFAPNAITFFSAALLFLSMATSRLLGGEDWIRGQLRAWLRAQDTYADRGEYQTALVVGVLLVGIPLCAVIVRYVFRSWSNRSVFLARITQFACVAFLILFALRIISLHFTDQILYAGPIRPNWVIDIGLTATVFLAATFHWWLGRGKEKTGPSYRRKR